MLGKKVENNLLILGKVVKVYAKNTLRVPILVERKFSMTLLIQEEGVLMLKDPKLVEFIFKAFEIGGEKVQDFPPKLATKGNLFPFFSILYLKQGK